MTSHLRETLVALVAVLAVTTALAQSSEPPAEQPQPPPCTTPGAGGALCATTGSSQAASLVGACPIQGRPEFPKAAVVNRINGVVTVAVKVQNGVVAEILEISGPRVYHQVVREALAKYKCAESAAPIFATQTFNFKVD